ncbi:hypothetical protein [Streptomyces sp. 7N604]
MKQVGFVEFHHDEAFTRPCVGWAWRRLNRSALAAEFGTRLPR